MYEEGSWTLDFIRAINERSVLTKILFRLIVGKYAFREFIGIAGALEKNGWMPNFEYGCKNLEYHKDKIPFKWWQ